MVLIQRNPLVKNSRIVILRVYLTTKGLAFKPKKNTRINFSVEMLVPEGYGKKAA